MKKFIVMLIMLSTLLGMFAYAEDVEIKVMMNGDYIKFNYKPVMIDGRIMVPLREIFENFGAELNYDQDIKLIKVRQGRKTVYMSPDVPQAIYENGAYRRNYKLDVPPTNIDSVTYIPIRFAAEAFGMKADWDKNNNTVVLINLDVLWKKLENNAPILYNGFFDANSMSEKSIITGATKVKYAFRTNKSDTLNNFSFNIDTQGHSDGELEKKDSYVSIDANGPAFDGVGIPVNVNFTTILKKNQYFIRTDLWSSMNNLSIVKKYDSMWLKAGAEGSEQIPFYVMFGLNLKKFIDSYIKDSAFKANINTYNYLNSVVDGVVNLEKNELRISKEGYAKVTLLDFEKDGLNSMSRDVSKKIDVGFYAQKKELEGEFIDSTFRLKISIPNEFDFTYENTLGYKQDKDISEIENVPESQIAKYDDIADALKLAEVLIKIIK